ncbi:NAD(P)H-dependent oxidoreductase [Streptomyces sp. NBC_01261]|uniref:NADPH-dependent FMN reductase n=1 Tax=unclassified Streptomyces TaxID=2593676 RepID=UPI002E33B190|nr:NAD(P)H-dependent oxidoreductase [Streptomyces sp. NBC_01261]
MPKLHVVIGSTRPGRLGLPIGQWAAEAAGSHGGFDVELVDLAEVGLPLLDEPIPPRMGHYTQEHTRAWSATVEEADAFVFVTPEHNYGPPASLLNALSFLHREWLYKPAAFVSYGGAGAGLRSVQVLKQVLTTLKVMPVPEGVAIPFVFQLVQDGAFRPSPQHETESTAMFDELLRWTDALQNLRKDPPAPTFAMPPAPLAP